MCGIAGALIYSGGGQVAKSDLAGMCRSMAHRGPDAEGTWLSGDAKVGLAHRRLTIIDLADEAGQPMANEDGEILVTYNGEIYNHAVLRSELIAAGHRFRTDHSDTEVVAHGYEEWGLDGLLQRLEGMFAFAVWDNRTRTLFLARDRIGIKPVYFTRHGGAFLFGSEIKALLAYPGVPRRVGRLALYHYLSYLTTPAPLTMFDGIYKLPAATWIEVDASGRMQATRYWRALPGQGMAPGALDGLSGAAREDYLSEGIRARLNAAVEKRMMSDVPYGAFLSGGIDSSVNVALMDRYTDDPVNTFTVGFKDHEHLNELDHAARVAREFNTNHHEVLVDEAAMVEYLDDLVHQQDEPLADWVCIPLHFVSQLAQEAGAKVIQVGEGSDEQFCGYNGYMKYLQLHATCFGPFRTLLPGFARRPIAALAHGAARLFPDFEQYADAVSRAAEGREAFWSGAMAYWESQKSRLLPGFSADAPSGFEDVVQAGLLPEEFLQADSYHVAASYLAEMDDAAPGSDQLTRMIGNEFRLRLPELLLMRVDKITMASSLEARVPFLDHDLVEFTMDIPAADKIKGGAAKHLLKRAVAGLIPDDIIHRKKMGFAAPMKEWLLGDFGRTAGEEILASPLLDEIGADKDMIGRMIGDHRSGKRDAALLIWVLFNLTAWHAHWIET
ncbi:MAG: asparagine synthase (glutamine-hydrolyzing) [Rhodospirillaceae bacterium]|nr:asparagine synthase (glutamine-hydrolyzing) [Rhodospirillaceae bacterium]MBT3885588.1 asparagine synthase (glutamine-hydrolyzing) [Rhodospirillaceae bacterium]MBT4116085.1 asparagine synthase (glutamine-hydrolyzing) [Rhodospirillaceae bacterium]MBT4673996.1 asparagine synthase (glutamine-hydrolyzing) [Rhodospirillaceae bacterium]MBT4717957.1 asparagine synthase (glutamine-hydrolyzing) [Rhodospirillaceae bacterium]